MKKWLFWLILVLLFSVGLSTAFAAPKPTPSPFASQEAETLTPSPVPSSAPLPTEQPNYKGKIYGDASTEQIDMGDITVKDFDAFYAFLDSLPNLKSVDMFATKVKKNRMEEMTLRYPGVHFGWTMVMGEHTIRTDQTAFSTLHYRTSAPHKSEDFSILKYCDNLLALDVGHNQVDDLSFLYDLPNLRVLIIAINNISDITPVGSLKDLEYLEIFKNRITDISALSGLDKLLDLDICFNKIQDYSPLYGLTGLMRLWLYQSNSYNFSNPISEDVVAVLKEKLPDTYIDSTHYSTAGTWRKHAHYDVIKQMFKTGKYIPFAESAPLP